jgi:hypothetical protein
MYGQAAGKLVKSDQFTTGKRFSCLMLSCRRAQPDNPEAPTASEGATASADQVEDQHDQSYNQQKVNQAAADV